MEPEFQQQTQCSSEEEAELLRSVKKFKDGPQDKPVAPPRKQVSYKDSLIGDIPGAYAQAFSFEAVEGTEEESDSELDELVEGMVNVKLSKETKARIRAQWTKALIVKVYGKSVGYSYLTFKLNALWKPSARMDCVNLGHDFFLIKFSEESDYDKVLRGGPWFIGEHFLAIKPWEPYFKASEATFSAVAVWIRLPELPIEFYDPAVLREIGGAIGPVLRIDAYTAMGTRASYARLCIQVDLTKPLIMAVRVGKLRQKVLYEGISSLCFCCGRLGHKLESCNYHVQPTVKTGVVDPAPHEKSQDEGCQLDHPKETNYGEWMLVTKRKKSSQLGRRVGNMNPSQQADISSRSNKGNIGLSNSSQVPYYPELTFQFKAGQTSGAVGSADNNLEPCDFGGLHTQNRHADGAKCSSNVSPSTLSRGKDDLEQRTTLVKGKGKAILPPHDKKISQAIGRKSRKRPNPDPPSRKKSLSPISCPFSTHVPLRSPLSSLTSNGVGDLAQEQSLRHPERDIRADQSCSDGHDGELRRGINGCLEAHHADNSNKRENRGCEAGSSGMGLNPKSMVEVSNRCAINLEGGSTRVERAQEAIGNASLGRIRVGDTGEESDRLQGIGSLPSGEFSHIEVVPNSQPSQEMRPAPVLQGGHSGHPDIHDSVEAGMEGVQGPAEEFGMEHDCHIQNGN